MNRTIDRKNRIALVCGALALICAIFSFAGCDFTEENTKNNVKSSAFFLDI
ncbi:hypothetical protein FACS189485_00930 [Spirochaetia bacterium]|nr:hypothetical protein FACS1894110_11930 [Spirochaetia bacterium]GHV01828.1 hypothetical protein FACS189485_00930 [Spirochaetia bacterium]